MLDHPLDGIWKHCVFASSFRLSVAPLAMGFPFTMLVLPAASFTSHSTLRPVASAGSGFFTRKMCVATVSWGGGSVEVVVVVAGVHGQLFAAWVQGSDVCVGTLPGPLLVGLMAASWKSVRLLLVSVMRVRLIVMPSPAVSVSGVPEVARDAPGTVFALPV